MLISPKMKCFLPSLLYLAFLTAQAQPSGYTYAKLITIDYTKTSGTGSHASFPVLVSITDANLKSTANGGHVANASGYDIIFTSSDCLTLLNFQLEKYDATTGEYIAWVKIPSLSTTANTSIQMYYGNNTVATDLSSQSTWDANYKGVWHFNNSVNDGTSNATNLTDISTSNLAAGKVGQARDLNNSANVASSVATGQHLRLPNAVLASISNFTFEGWVYLDRDATNWERVFDFGQSTTTNFFFTLSSVTGSPAETRARITINGLNNEQGPIVTNASAVTGSWNHWAVVLQNSTSTMTIYRNGALYGSSNTVTLTPNSMEASTANYFGRSQYTGDHYIDAKFDEFRISSTNRSAGWITTAYNNQNSPSTFYSVAAEVSAPTGCTSLPIRLLSFDAVADNEEVKISWITSSEASNDYFTVERSQNAINWETVSKVSGAGNSVERLRYTQLDLKPYLGKSYYRLKQTDFDGTSTYSKIRSVDLVSKLGATLFPNPTRNEFTVGMLSLANESEEVTVAVYNSIGQKLTVDVSREGNRLTIHPVGLRKGAYFVHIVHNAQREIKKIVIE